MVLRLRCHSPWNRDSTPLIPVMPLWTTTIMAGCFSKFCGGTTFQLFSNRDHEFTSAEFLRKTRDNSHISQYILSLLISLVHYRNMTFHTAFLVNISIQQPQKLTSGSLKETIRATITFLYILLLLVGMARIFPTMTTPSGGRMSPKLSTRRSTSLAQSYTS